ncbi:MAG: septum formation initiator family protein [Butyricicoccaceae bacterium]
MRARRKSRIMLPVKLAAVVLGIALLFYMASFQVRISDLEAQCEELDNEISYKEMTNQELEDSIESGMTDDDIAKIAREILGYASPGERVFIDSSSK